MAGGNIPAGQDLRMAGASRTAINDYPARSGVQTMGQMPEPSGSAQRLAGAPAKPASTGGAQTPPDQAGGARATATGMSPEQLRSHQLAIGGIAHAFRAGHVSRETMTQVQGAARAKIASHNASRQGGVLPRKEMSPSKPRRFGSIAPSGMMDR